jgi:4-hydroxy-2-oxoheptanedioate aldolase
LSCIRRPDHERLVGTVLTLGDVALAELACGPVDLVWIDLEHAALDVADVQRLAIACRATSTLALVRVPAVRSERLGAILDTGVDGIVVPGVASRAQAAEAVAGLRHPPAGRRGYGPRRAGDFGRHSVIGEVPVCWTQIESAAGVASSSEIAAVDGVDALALGPADLSFDLGVPLAYDAPELKSAAAAVAAAAAEAGIPLAVAGPPDVLDALALRPQQVAALVCSVDVRLYASAVDAVAADARAALAVDAVTA